MAIKFNSILLIDDKVANNRYNQIILEQMNIFNKIEIAERGEEALLLLLLNENQADRKLIFLDINMPGMNGWEFLEEYKAAELDIKTNNIIIVLTTSMNPEDKIKAEKIAIVSEFCIKPLTPGKIMEIAEKYSNQP